MCNYFWELLHSRVGVNDDLDKNYDLMTPNDGFMTMTPHVILNIKLLTLTLLRAVMLLLVINCYLLALKPLKMPLKNGNRVCQIKMTVTMTP